jgi:integrase
MNNRYRKFKRGNVWWCHDGQTGKQTSLKTKSEAEAIRLLDVKNWPHQNAGHSLQLARTYLQIADAASAERTWQDIFDAIIGSKTGNTKFRWERAAEDKAYDSIRDLIVAETKADALLEVMKNGKVSTNVFLRRLHNHALGMNWLLVPIIAKKMWPEVKFREKRAITQEEHQRIIEREKNPERRAFYEVCWYVGGSQTDMALLKAEDIDWQKRVLTYFRCKTGTKAQIRIGIGLEEVLRSRPSVGYLFPHLASVREGDRATEFRQRRLGLGINGVSLHSYRYSWAERAKAAAYPERYAQEALGHASKAVHRAYAKNGEVLLPALEDAEREMQSKMLKSAPSSAVAA